MGEKKKIYKPKAISGYPEWLPQVRRVEQQWLDHIRAVFESYGFCNIETPAVEALEVIAAKGEDVDKEIYVLERLQKEEGDKEARLALQLGSILMILSFRLNAIKRRKFGAVRGHRPGVFVNFTNVILILFMLIIYRYILTPKCPPLFTRFLIC